MKFTDEHVFEQPLDVVRKAYFDPEFAPKKYAALGLQDIKVTAQGKTGDESFVTCRFKMLPTINVPGFAQKFIKQDKPVGVQQTDRWNTTTNTGSLLVELAGMTSVTSLECQMTLEKHSKGTVNRMSWSVECKVPLIGGKLAKLLAEDIQQKSEADRQATAEILKSYA